MIRALSVMTAVGISGNVAEELPKLCGTLESLTPNDVLSNINQLTRSGFVRHVGNYLEVIPPVLANRSAALGLAGRETQLSTFLSALSPPGAARLLRRIQQLPENALRSFLHEPFHGGELSSFPRALQNIELLRLLAPAAPTQAIGLVEAGLTQMSIEERRQMEPGARRGVIWTIEELLFRQRTSAAALRSLSLLAEAETEQWGNNATHVFGECFYPLHPQFPLALNERISILREFVTNDATRERKLIAIGATRDAFNTHAVITLRRSSGPVPFDAVPQMTYAEVYDYWETLIDFLRRLMTDSDAEVVTEAGRAFIRAVGDFTIRGRQAGGVRMLEELLAPVVTASLPIRLEDYAETLNISYRGLQVNFPDESARVMELIGAIDKGNFDTRARRWIGSWDFGEQEKDEDGNLAFHSEIEIRKLAQDPATDSAVVSESLFQWLQSKEAKRAPEFFFWLGRRDEAGNWIREIDRRGETLEGELAFACYYGGRASISPDLADDKLEILTSAGLVRPEALLGATSYLPGSGRAVTRILELLRRGLSPLLAERRLMGGGWMKPLSASEAATLLRAIAGPGLENAAPVIDFLAMWVHSNKALEGELGELAWRALETAPKTGEPWDFDLVAATLLPGDLDRAFALLIGLLTLPSDLKRWEPLDRHGGNRFWNALWAADRRRCLVRLLEVGVGSPLARLRISWHLPEILDLEQDGEVLLDFARRDTASAEFVSSCLRASRPGFWPVALALLALDPENKVIRGNIANAAQHMGDVIAGPFSDHYNRCAAAVEEVLRTNNHPSTTRTFLRTLAEELRREAAREHREEDDESVNW